MKVGPIILGAVIGGAVWCFSLRATAAATKTPPGGELPPPADDTVRDGQGDVLSTPPVTCSEVADIAACATDQTTVIVDGDKLAAGISGTTGSVVAVTTDPINKTITPDVDHPAGGQGTDQMAGSSGVVAPPDEAPPAYSSAEPKYTDYLTARYGTTEGMTDQQISAALVEAARMGGLAL